MTFKKCLFFVLSVLMISVLVLGSCGEPTKTTQPTTQPTTQTTTQPTTQTTTQPTTQPTTPAGPVYGGIMRGILPAGPQLMTYRGRMGPSDHRALYGAVESLMQLTVDENGNRGWKPWLLESYDIDPEAMTFTLHLRKGVKFHDGSILDAGVVIWNYEQAIESGWQQGVDKLISMETPDDYTVVLSFTEYSNQWEFDWGYTWIWSQQAWEEASGGDLEKGLEWARDHVVGTGPFKLKEYKRDVIISFERFDDYWQEGKPYLDGTEFLIITESTTASNLLQAGDVDIWVEGSAPQDWKELEAKGFVIKRGYGGFPHCLYPNTLYPPTVWNDKRLREAIEYAIDKEAIAEAIGLGYYFPLPQIKPETEWGNNPDLDIREYNPEKARQLLADAGYEDGLPITLLVQSVTQDMDAGEAIKQYLDDVGFEVTLDIADPGRYFGSVFAMGWEDLVLMFYTTDWNSLATYRSWWSSDPKSNLHAFERTPEQIAMEQEAFSAVSEQEQMEVTEKILTYLYEEARLTPLWWIPYTCVAADYLHTAYPTLGLIQWEQEKIWMDPH